jgi:hypothetical protein
MAQPRYRSALGSIKAATAIGTSGHATMATTTVIAARAIRARGATTEFEAIRDAKAARNTGVAGADIKATDTAAATDADTMRAMQRGHAGIDSGMASLHVALQNPPSSFPSDIAKKTIAMKKQIF